MVCNGFGVRRSYVGATIAISCIWAILGLLVLAGIQDFRVLCLSGVLLGALMSVTTVIKPFFARSFLRGDQISESYARQSLVTGLAWAVGALGGGFIIETLGPGWAIITNALLTLPLAITIGRTGAYGQPEIRSQGARAYRRTITVIRASARLREAALVGACTVILIGPAISMVVPLADSLRQAPVNWAGILMAAIGLGRVLTPVTVGRVGARHSPIDGMLIINTCAGKVLIGLALSSTVLAGEFELLRALIESRRCRH